MTHGPYLVYFTWLPVLGETLKLSEQVKGPLRFSLFVLKFVSLDSPFSASRRTSPHRTELI